MALIDTSDIRKGLKVKINNQPWAVVGFQFVKPGKGNAFTTTKLKNLISGNVIERTYKTGEKLEKVMLDEQPVQFLYADGDEYNFMNTETFDQFHVTADQLGDATKWLLENMEIVLQFFEGNPISVEMPTFVELEVAFTEPAVKGNTATGATKIAKMETGAELQVPLFINQGEKLRIDTRTGEYVERAKS
jgi:elongation factor P